MNHRSIEEGEQALLRASTVASDGCSLTEVEAMERALLDAAPPAPPSPPAPPPEAQVMPATSGSAGKRVRSTKMLEQSLRVDSADAQVRDRAACVLEVLAGVRSPEEAAEALGLVIGSYFQLEERALRGLVSACGAQAKGKPPDLCRALEESRRRVGELEREVQRHQALLRSTQRAAGVIAQARAAPRATVEPGAARSVRSGRKPKARALRVVSALRGGMASGSAASDALARGVVERR